MFVADVVCAKKLTLIGRLVCSRKVLSCPRISLGCNMAHGRAPGPPASATATASYEIVQVRPIDCGQCDWSAAEVCVAKFAPKRDALREHCLSANSYRYSRQTRHTDPRCDIGVRPSDGQLIFYPSGDNDRCLPYASWRRGCPPKYSELKQHF